jgi:radical SAM protein with 4Fe4S-binding SPASM domain
MSTEKVRLTELMGVEWQKGKPGIFLIETTGKCLGSCSYCYSGSTGLGSGFTLPTERIKELLVEIKEVGAQAIYWTGGDALLHPDLFELMDYTQEVGLRNRIIQTNPMSITKEKAKKLVASGVETIGIHIDSIDPAIYSQVHTNPKTLEQKIRGYNNLLDAGYPPNQTWACICLTKQTIQSLEQTFEWFLNMGASFISYIQFRPVGLAYSGLEHLELSVSEQKWACEYRARMLDDPELLRLGSSDSRSCCQNMVVIKDDGGVTPCPLCQDIVVGNIYQQSLVDIFNKNREALLFDFEIKGRCGDCENSDICFGCRANAFYMAGDITASDPRCWLNPDNKAEYLLQKDT